MSTVRVFAHSIRHLCLPLLSLLVSLVLAGSLSVWCHECFFYYLLLSCFFFILLLSLSLFSFIFIFVIKKKVSLSRLACRPIQESPASPRLAVLLTVLGNLLHFKFTLKLLHLNLLHLNYTLKNIYFKNIF